MTACNLQGICSAVREYTALHGFREMVNHKTARLILWIRLAGTLSHPQTSACLKAVVPTFPDQVHMEQVKPPVAYISPCGPAWQDL